MFAGLATFRRDPAAGDSIARRRRSALAVLIIAFAATSFAHAQHLIVVSSGDSPANARAIVGMRNNPSWTIETRRVGDHDDLLASTLAHAPAGTAIVAMGASAAQYVAQLSVAAPTVDCMVAGDLRIVSAAPVVPLAMPIDVQIKWMKQLLPAARKVAILFDPAQNELTAADAAQQLTVAGYTVMSEEVSSPERIPPALAKIGDADALLALPDRTVYSPELARGLLLFTYRTHTPMIALSDAWVRAGALYSLEWDYAELGNYCAELAAHLMSTAKNATPPVLPKPQVSVNRRAAAQLRLNWDAASLAGVDRVHD